MGNLTSIERKVDTIDLRRGAPAVVDRIRGGRLDTSNAIVNARLDWHKATACCTMGLMLLNSGSPRIFKNILKYNMSQYRKAFEEAERCAFYDSE